jgi:hypothetical protein
LTGWKIDIIGASEYEKEKAVRDQESRAAIAQQLQDQHAKLMEAESAAAQKTEEQNAEGGISEKDEQAATNGEELTGQPHAGV